MPFFRKKPIVIEARQFTKPSDIEELVPWINNHAGKPLAYDDSFAEAPAIQIETLEGSMTAGIGDWIIRGVKGEFYPCKADVFEASYEPAEVR